MDEIFYREKMMWLQRSHIAGLKEGDMNTKFFHMKAAGRAKKNKIKCLRRDDDQLTEDKKEIEGMACKFFQDLYGADPAVQPEELLQLIQPQITPEMNGLLCREFTKEEISDALFQIGPLKALGPDDFPARFFQRNWDTVKTDVVKGVQNFFASGVMPPRINDTTIVLIPKKEESELLKDFRPISLCNVIYKVVSKCLVNRLRPLLQDLIAPTQSAFIPGRLITDNVLIAFECLHAIRHGNKDSKRFGAYKLDLTKAYDHVDWGFLEGALRRLGFQSTWVGWIMECVATVQYSVRLNNVPLEPFRPTHGLRQGDPLSPYLFLFVADGMSKLLQHEVNMGTLRELHVSRHGPGISRLLFADDTLLFIEVLDDQAAIVDNTLRRYERSTGQLINPVKCSMMFGVGSEQES
jgi:hypothetical protein